ncbi:TonB-dependent receptor [Rhodopseudomonas palustris]|uniref:TonB-dependent receptor n=1 Tax=Rhodopseudomonas palustris TaxID=1076 RepID=A0A323UB52_RHOPL|nr:TonB-dependent receptor [Rhodopseudomonas palustris]PZA09479.1 TonB-dependent receptor [Rhodopseudomonas palustris]
MSSRLKTGLLLGTATLAVCSAGAPSARAQTALPEVTVTAPSPIQRRHHTEAKPRPAPRVTTTARQRGAAPAETPPVAQAAPAPLPGTLPIVTDQFATVTVVPNEEIRRTGGGTLGDLLGNKPGISASQYAPGGASRPIIRGMDVNRVSIIENGIGSNGASDLGEDHFVPVDPLSTNQIEVIRGPATLRYGSTAIGGVVSATNNRIPDALPPCAQPFQSYGMAKPPTLFGGAGCMNGEVRSSFSSVDRGTEGAVLLDAAGNNVAVHADVYGRRAGDYDVPSYPYAAPGFAFNGRQANSAAQAAGGSIGGSYLFDGGFIGAAVTQNNSLYRIPGAEGAEVGTRIDAKQTKFSAKGEYRPDTAAIDAIRFWVGATDYKHNEIGLSDSADLTSDGVRQTFTNREQEGRLEVQLAPFNAGFAAVTTALGAQVGHQELTAPSPDDPGSPLNGLFDPNKNTRVAGYIFNELQFTNTTKAQVAGRIEHVELSGSTPSAIPELFNLEDDPSAIGPATQRSLSFTPKSLSLGLIQALPWGLSASVTGQYTERAPKPAELFSRGGHDATATFDIGNPNLKIETAKSVEVGLRRAEGPFRFEITAYYTQFSGFIYRRLTGNTCEEVECGAGAGLELNQAIYSQRDATFKGGEFQSQLDVAQLYGGTFGIENQFDIVRATFADGTNVPRIPPMRVGGGLYWRDANWLMKVNLLHAFAQNDVAPIAETTTPGYNLLKAEVSYRTKLDPSVWGAREMLVGLVGNNLLNEDIRIATSYSKDNVLMPGIGVRAFANVKF